ncbi:MAG TPA: isoprenylcysteine carboxylmethyltransferase family protein [Terricaulis sp.]|nr:isoprenylcysteine carboxylmethyltransferase family protein [Terricaulis sp.]
MVHVAPPFWALLFLVGTFALSFAPGFSLLEPMSTRPAGLAIIAASLTLLLAAMGQFWFVNTQILPDSTINNALVTDGLFGLTRNPMYIAMVVMCLGFAFLLGRATMFAAPVMMFAVLNWAFIPFEEAKMRRQFGDAYDAYMKRVRRWL